MSTPGNDPLARRLAAAALAFALVAVVLAGYSVMLGQQYLEDVRVLGEALERNAPEPTFIAPPPPLETE